MPQLECGDYSIDYEDIGNGSPVILIPSPALSYTVLSMKVPLDMKTWIAGQLNSPP